MGRDLGNADKSVYQMQATVYLHLSETGEETLSHADSNNGKKDYSYHIKVMMIKGN